MSLPATVVNPQVTDAVTQANLAVIGQAPALAMGSMFQVASQAMSLMMQNGTTGQNAMNQVGVAVVSSSIARMISMIGPTKKSGDG